MNPLVTRIEDRIAAVSMVPKENGEGLQVRGSADTVARDETSIHTM
jgi:hypothetical protein